MFCVSVVPYTGVASYTGGLCIVTCCVVFGAGLYINMAFKASFDAGEPNYCYTWDAKIYTSAEIAARL